MKQRGGDCFLYYKSENETNAFSFKRLQDRNSSHFNFDSCTISTIIRLNSSIYQDSACSCSTCRIIFRPKCHVIYFFLLTYSHSDVALTHDRPCVVCKSNFTSHILLLLNKRLIIIIWWWGCRSSFSWLDKLWQVTLSYISPVLTVGFHEFTSTEFAQFKMWLVFHFISHQTPRGGKLRWE